MFFYAAGKDCQTYDVIVSSKFLDMIQVRSIITDKLAYCTWTCSTMHAIYIYTCIMRYCSYMYVVVHCVCRRDL